MKPITVKLIDKQGVGTSSEYLALCRGEGDSLSNATLGEGTTARAAYAEAMNAWFTRSREAAEAALERERVTKPEPPELSEDFFTEAVRPSGPIIGRRTNVTFQGIKSLLQDAALEPRSLVDIVYQGVNDDEPQERQITPLSVFSRSTASAPFADTPENTYVLAKDRRTGVDKQFRLDRLTRAELVG